MIPNERTPHQTTFGAPLLPVDLNSVPKAMTIAGSDSGGGAGIQADLKTFAAHGVFGTSCLTAVTAQNTTSVLAIAEVPEEVVVHQIDGVIEDIGTDAVKIGMLSSASIIECVSDRLDAWGITQIVVDPVMVAKSGDALLQPNAVRALVKQLLPLALVVTPNVAEAQVLSAIAVVDDDSAREAARKIHSFGPRLVVIKGGHRDTIEATDLVFDGISFHEFSSARINTPHTHGTGCTFSAAIAANLALGIDPMRAIELAKIYLSAAIAGAYQIGMGHSPVNHFATVPQIDPRTSRQILKKRCLMARPDNPLIIAGEVLKSRLFVGTGKYRSSAEMNGAFKSAECDLITVALRRIDFDDPASRSVLDDVDWKKYRILPNTAGCQTAEEAIRIARMARAMELSDWVKLEVIPDPKYLLPDPIGTLDAARVLIDEGFVVLPYIGADPILAKRLQEMGCATVMPLGSPIGSGQGVINIESIKIIIEQATVPVVVDAGIGTPSDAAIAMEAGADAVLINTAIALADDPAEMAMAMAMAVQAGRKAYLAGRIPVKPYASASSPVTSLVS